MDLNKYIRDIEDFPKKWIIFKDITPLLQDPGAFSYAIDLLAEKSKNSDVIVWLDARGFIFASAVAYKLKKPLVIVRKKWKLPYESISISYDLEYGTNVFDIHIDSIKAWDKVSIIDDLLATWWTAEASIKLVEKLWWKVENLNFVINLSFLDQKKSIQNYNINSLITY